MHGELFSKHVSRVTVGLSEHTESFLASSGDNVIPGAGPGAGAGAGACPDAMPKIPDRHRKCNLQAWLPMHLEGAERLGSNATLKGARP